MREIRPGSEPVETGEAKDRLFSKRRESVDDFDFGHDTAAVFDDMLARSVPYYDEIQRMTAELAADFAVEGTRVYDLGCSTCNSFLQIDRVLPRERDVTFVGIDSSPAMLDLAREKLHEAGFRRKFELAHADMNREMEIANASVVLLILTLQFVRPLHRDKVIRRIYEGLTDSGCVIVVEKVLGESSTFNRLFIQHYYEMKRRNGYSEMEISQKREALENVLVPYRLNENMELFRRHGFSNLDVFFKWYNFTGFLAMK